jgi:hypothetical protein
MSKDALHLFLAYSRKDEKYRRELTSQFSPLRRQGLIVTWTDRLINPGANWEEKISVELEKADIIILLISADFIHSNYCIGIEMTRAMVRQESGSAQVIPVIVRSCLYHGLPFAKLQVLPYEGKPIKQWRDKDLAYLSVVQGVENVAREILKDSSSISEEWLGSLLARRKVVRIVQRYLKDKGFYFGVVDGEPANIHLRDAVRHFQMQAGVVADGLIGPETLRKITQGMNGIELGTE